MRILVLNADYPRFLDWLYRRQPGLENTSYTTQMLARNGSLFGLADFYSKNFAALGHPAAEIHVNNPWLQAAWASEHGMAVQPLEAAPPMTVKPFVLNWLMTVSASWGVPGRSVNPKPQIATTGFPRCR